LGQICQYYIFGLIDRSDEQLRDLTRESYEVEIQMIADIMAIECIAIILEIISPYLMSLLFPVSPYSPRPSKKVRKHIFPVSYHLRYRGIEKVKEGKFGTNIIHGYFIL
jgi:hypothetical protein